MSDKFKLLYLASKFNNAKLSELQKAGFLPLYFETGRIGTLGPHVIDEMKNYPTIFSVCEDRVLINPELDSYEARSEGLRRFLEDMRDKQIFCSLEGWRDECYETRLKFSDDPVFKIERAGAPLLGKYNRVYS